MNHSSDEHRPDDAAAEESLASDTPETSDTPDAPATPQPDADETPAPEAVVEMAEAAPAEPESVSTPTAEATTDATESAAGEAAESPEPAEATMAEAAAEVPDQKSPKSGQRMAVKIVQLGDEQCFVDFGGRSEGAIATTELKDDEGNVPFQIGDTLQATVKTGGDTVVFTLGKKGAAVALKKIEDAFHNKVPLQGHVKSTNKGGFEVNLGGARAFCPFSQIELGYCDNPEQYVGQKLPFQVITYERGGRNVVVSHRKILEAQASEQAKGTRELLSVGAELEGTVRRLQPYGAFVDIGGLDGLVHVSEIHHGHVADPKEVLKVGQKVQVRVLKLEGIGTDRERISLSMKQTQPDPWQAVADALTPGSTVAGKVVRLTDFGAFVEIQPGVDGLIHISQISTERIGHPGDELTVGQDVEARVLSVEVSSQRISLTLKPEGSEDRRPPRRAAREEPVMASSSSSEETEPTPDVTNMNYSDAIELLKQKFQGD